MTGLPGDLEVRYRWLLLGSVILFGVAFAFGLILYVLDEGSAASLLWLQTGLVLLMASPAVRMLVASVERIRRRDWTFLALTAVVVAELALVLWRAATRS
ncbi:MAG TPA: DUF1634 domain-containing protein [Vicinamibacterales bacterium]|nr:DUF1634 domain-containing protein [Vicinamibacterales bacterium]